jgi:hypothetical protein
MFTAASAAKKRKTPLRHFEWDSTRNQGWLMRRSDYRQLAEAIG